VRSPPQAGEREDACDPQCELPRPRAEPDQEPDAKRHRKADSRSLISIAFLLVGGSGPTPAGKGILPGDCRTGLLFYQLRNLWNLTAFAIPLLRLYSCDTGGRMPA
jgi:hypothetical protein